MHIIFEEKLVPELQERYIVLELDTILQPGMEKPLTLYALIENIDISILSNLPNLISSHQNLISKYKNSNWIEAVFLANSLMGSWKGELDEFYQIVCSRFDLDQDIHST